MCRPHAAQRAGPGLLCSALGSEDPKPVLRGPLQAWETLEFPPPPPAAPLLLGRAVQAPVHTAVHVSPLGPLGQASGDSGTEPLPRGPGDQNNHVSDFFENRFTCRRGRRRSSSSCVPSQWAPGARTGLFVSDHHEDNAKQQESEVVADSLGQSPDAPTLCTPLCSHWKPQLHQAKVLATARGAGTVA